MLGHHRLLIQTGHQPREVLPVGSILFGPGRQRQQSDQNGHEDVHHKPEDADRALAPVRVHVLGQHERVPPALGGDAERGDGGYEVAAEDVVQREGY